MNIQATRPFFDIKYFIKYVDQKKKYIRQIERSNEDK
jgi:hypothetical protein